MFKHGQLVRSRISNLFGVVVSSNKYTFRLRIVSSRAKGEITIPLYHDDDYCELVGNNYNEAGND